MYARDGYVPFSRLWMDFESKFLPLCKVRALACMEADRHSPDFVFGTALDLCEDVFLRSFDERSLDLVPLLGDVVQLDPVIQRSGAKLLLKMTAFESAQVSQFQDEAGPDGKWLKQMGSPAFCPAGFGFLLPDKMGRDAGADLEKVLFADVFHTLPVLFERQAFVITKELPPWSVDQIEKSFIRNVWQETRGFSICLSEASAKLWKRSLTSQKLAKMLGEIIPAMSEVGDQDSQPAGGRPEKLSDVKRAYQELGLEVANMTRKEELREIEAYLKERISPSTLDRTRRTLRNAKSEDYDNHN